MPSTPKNLQELLDRIENATSDRDAVSVGNMVREIGSQSFGPLFVFAGVIGVSPLSGIPGIPTTLAVLVLLVSMQMLFRRHCCWLPQWILRRSIARTKVTKALQWLRPPARFIDRLLRPRLTRLLENGGAYAVAAVCAVVAVGVPVLELVPFAATLAGTVFVIFGLAIIARDGVLALLGFACSAIVFGFAIAKLLS